MNETELYSRQKPLNLSLPQKAAIIGCGGTGTWVALNLAMLGVPYLILVDNDTIETSNLARLPYRANSVGSYKTEALRGFLATLRPYLHSETHTTEVTEDNIEYMLMDADVVFCCTDNIPSQKLVCAYCRTRDKRYQRVGYDGTVLNVSDMFPFSFGDESAEDLAARGYTVTPSAVFPAMAAAAAGVASVVKQPMTITCDMFLLEEKGTGNIPKALVDNIRDEITERFEGYEDCSECNRGNCGSCNRGDCDSCDRGDCDSCDRGICNDCDRLEFGTAQSDAHHDINQILSKIMNNLEDPAEEVTIRGSSFYLASLGNPDMQSNLLDIPQAIRRLYSRIDQLKEALVAANIPVPEEITE